MAQELSKAVYTCIYIEPYKILNAYKLLLDSGIEIPPLPDALQGVCCNHMTIKFRPTTDDVCRLPMGGAVDLVITGVAHDDSCTAIRVKQVYGCPVPSDNPVPHITMWVSEGTPPYYSNELLAKGVIEEVENGPLISGTVGYCTGSSFKFDYQDSIYMFTGTQQ